MICPSRGVEGFKYIGGVRGVGCDNPDNLL